MTQIKEPTMKHSPITLFLLPALLAVTLATGCRRDEPAPSDVPETAPQAADADAKVPGTDATAVSPNTDAEAGVQPVEGTLAAFDARGFSGTFAAEGTRVELRPDGSYALQARAESAGAELASDGTWAVEPDGKHLLLDPNSKDETDRRYAVVSADALKADDGGQVLRREGAR